MSTIRFTDGVEFDTGGERRLERRGDGWYVVGRGMLLPVADPEDGERVMARLAEARAGKPGRQGR